MKPRFATPAPLILAIITVCAAAVAAEEPVAPAAPDWPPPIADAVNGTVTFSSPDFLVVPQAVEKARNDTGSAVFTVAKTPVTIDLAPHRDLPDAALNGTGWSAWGDICVAADGKVYSGIGDHGKDVLGKGHVFIYCFDPAAKILKQIVDPNAVAGVDRENAGVTFSKVHAAILEGADHKIYFTCTINSGGKAGTVAWTPKIPGGLIYRYDPVSAHTDIVGHFDGELTATTRVDPQRNILYACLEGKTAKPADAALGAFDLTAKKWIYTSPHDAIYFDRNLALDSEGNVYFNGKGGELWKFDRGAQSLASTSCSFGDAGSGPKGATPSMRASTTPTHDGTIFGTTMGPGRLFRFSPAKNSVELLGPDFGTGNYTAVVCLSPDEKYLYYLPGAHGGAKDIGTPVVQYEIATGNRKVLAFLGDPIEKKFGVRLAGTYGCKLSADGGTLYVNFNGHAREDLRMPKMRPIGFGLTSFVAIHIPASERP